jgi:hypothetical protein
MALGSTKPPREINTRNFPRGKGWSARRAQNLIAICELIACKIWRSSTSSSNSNSSNVVLVMFRVVRGEVWQRAAVLRTTSNEIKWN